MKTQLLLYFVTIISVLSSTMADSSEKRFYHEHEAEALFADFVKEHNKEYKDEADRNVHFNTFKENLKKINELNKQDGAVYGINKFSDLSKDEMRSYTNYRSK